MPNADLPQQPDTPGPDNPSNAPSHPDGPADAPENHAPSGDLPQIDPADPFREGREAVAAFRQALGQQISLTEQRPDTLPLRPLDAESGSSRDDFLDEAEIAQLSQDFFAGMDPGALPAPQLIQGIIFDFDNTLARLTRPLAGLMEEGGKNAVAYMRATGMDLYDSFWEQMIEARTFAESKSAEEQEEHIANDTLSFLLQFFGYPASRMDPNVLKSAVDMFYAPEMVAWELLPHAKQLLTDLNAQGYRLALVANYSCERVFQRIVDYLGLRPYFDLVVCSAGVEWRKPVPDIFQLAAARWDAMPHEVVVVGDSLAEDILGGLEFGALTVQVALAPGLISEADALAAAEMAGHIAPDAVIHSLDQLPALIHEWAAL